MKRTTVLSLVLVGLMLLMVSGCGSKVTKENLEKIKVGMTIDEVKDILGEPTEGGDLKAGALSAGAMTWKDGDKSIVVTFVGGKVSLPAAGTGLE